MSFRRGWRPNPLVYWNIFQRSYLFQDPSPAWKKMIHGEIYIYHIYIYTLLSNCPMNSHTNYTILPKKKTHQPNPITFQMMMLPRCRCPNHPRHRLLAPTRDIQSALLPSRHHWQSRNRRFRQSSHRKLQPPGGYNGNGRNFDISLAYHFWQPVCNYLPFCTEKLQILISYQAGSTFGLIIDLEGVAQRLSAIYSYPAISTVHLYSPTIP